MGSFLVSTVFFRLKFELITVHNVIPYGFINDDVNEMLARHIDFVAEYRVELSEAEGD